MVPYSQYSYRDLPMQSIFGFVWDFWLGYVHNGTQNRTTLESQGEVSREESQAALDSSGLFGSILALLGAYSPCALAPIERYLGPWLQLVTRSPSPLAEVPKTREFPRLRSHRYELSIL